MNVVGKMRGMGGGRSLLLHAHTDTVGVAGMTAPFSGRIDRGRLYGRGAYDIKSGLAAMLSAVKAIVDVGFVPGGDLLVAGVAEPLRRALGEVLGADQLACTRGAVVPLLQRLIERGLTGDAARDPTGR